MVTVVGQIISLKKVVYILILRTWEFVTLNGKRDLKDVIVLRILRWEIILDYLDGPNVSTRVLLFIKEAAVSELVAVDMKIQHEVGVMQEGAMSQAMHTAFRR